MELLAGALTVDVMGKDLWMWVLFLALVLTLLALDLGVLHKERREISMKESLILSAGYIMIALIFGAWVWWSMGKVSGINYLTGYFVEKSLSMDNIFVISLIFSYFGIPRLYQHRVLFWGILGVIVLRAIMIGVGAALVERFDWILFIFGGFLVLTGIKMLVSADHDPDMTDNAFLKFLRNHIPVTDRLHGEKFFVTEKNSGTGKAARLATPLFLALIMVEGADIVFAVDSIPAIFAITTDTYIVYTSNIFAILGLRALYFALAAMVSRFVYLKYALSAVLIFIGGKIFWNHFVGKVDPLVSLTVTLVLLAGGVIVSLLKTKPVPAGS
jgi:tellurite resistance protein TerC